MSSSSTNKTQMASALVAGAATAASLYYLWNKYNSMRASLESSGSSKTQNKQWGKQGNPKRKGSSSSSSSSGNNTNAKEKNAPFRVYQNEIVDSAAAGRILVLYATSTGTTKKWADFAHDRIVEVYPDNEIVGPVNLGRSSNGESNDDESPTDAFELEDIKDGDFSTIIILSATCQDGQPPEECASWFEHIKESSHDWRFGKAFLKGVRNCSIIGFGGKVWGKSLFCKPAKEVKAAMERLGCRKTELLQICTESLDDVSIEHKVASFVLKKTFGRGKEIKQKDSKQENRDVPVVAGKVVKSSKSSSCRPSSSSKVNANTNTNSSTTGCGKVDCCSVSPKDNGKDGKDSDSSSTQVPDDENDDDIMDEPSDDYSEASDLDASDDEKSAEEEEEMLPADKREKFKKDRERGEYGEKSNFKEMLTERQRANLVKEGYKIVGTHSAVKICRWTKHHLRGRGGCYKHTFYGIASFSCMEATPSLACANKCVFCWRHHKNPVGPTKISTSPGKEWQWKANEPEMIVDGWMAQHKQMIKQLKGVPGVSKERFEQAKQIKHCALSLVGEPIMYPYINELLMLLHGHGISTFLVTNAQFPKQLESIGACTQLYTSIDAATKDELKAVDRPLNVDFWEKFLRCIDILGTMEFNRTVFRLTLVKSYNMNDAGNYAKLVLRGKPDFIEIKGVTYNGDDKNSKEKMTMSNVPWHHEVLNFGLDIIKHEGPHIPNTTWKLI